MRDRINDDLKAALKARDASRTGTLRLIAAAIKDADIAARGEGREVGEADLFALLQKMIKQREESAAIYDKAGRAELADKERAEIAVIAEFLPAPLGEDEVAAAIDAAIAETGAASVKDMGRVVGLLRERHAGRMDFGRAAGLAKARLGG